MGGKDNGINFRQKFTTYLSKNIKLSDLMTEKENSKTKLKDGLGDIFSHFDSVNKDGELSADELNNIIKSLDADKNKQITDDEIKAYCDANGINKKMTKQLVERINNNLFGITGKIHLDNVPDGASSYVGSKTWYNIDKTKYGNDYIKYDTNIQDVGSRTENHRHSAIYDIKNDVFRPVNGNKNIEITGVKAFQSAAFENDNLKKLDENFDAFPKVVLTNADGTKSELALKIKHVDMSDIKNEEEYMMILTNLTSAISQLPSGVLEDLKNNVNYITINYLEAGVAGQAGSRGNSLDDYLETIALDVPSGIKDIQSTLVHEIGHTVDNNISGYATEQDSQKLNDFISNLKKSDIPYKLKSAYSLTDPQELFAEYYTHVYTEGKSHLSECTQLFNLLDISLKNGDPYGWSEIKALLDGVREKSIGLETAYAQKAANDVDYFTSLNKQEGGISEERIASVGERTLWDNFNNYDVRSKFDSVVSQYEEYFRKYRAGTPAEQLEVVISMRNHPDFKTYFEQMFDNAEKAVKERERKNNLSFKEALDDAKEMFDKNQTQPIDTTDLLKKINAKGSNELNDLLNSQGLRDAIINACTWNSEIPKAIRDKYQEGSNEPITTEVLLALRNEPNLWSFLIVDKEYFKYKKA